MAWASLGRANNGLGAKESQTLNSFLGVHSWSDSLKISANRITLSTGNWFWAPVEEVSPEFPALYTSGSDRRMILLPKGNAHLTCLEQCCSRSKGSREGKGDGLSFRVSDSHWQGPEPRIQEEWQLHSQSPTRKLRQRLINFLSNSSLGEFPLVPWCMNPQHSLQETWGSRQN